MSYESRFGKNRRVGRSSTNNFTNCSTLSVAWAIILILTLESALAGTTWDGGGGSNTNWGVASNWNNNTLPTFNSSTTLSFGTGGTKATNEITRTIGGIVFTRDADFTLDGNDIYLYGIMVDSTQTRGRTYTIKAPLSLQGLLSSQLNVKNGSSGTNYLDIQSNVNVTGVLTIVGPGIVQLSIATASLTSGSAIIGQSGAGNFSHLAGTFSNNGLSIGQYSGDNGTYNLTGTGQLTVHGFERIGVYGAGTFTQTGGTNHCIDADIIIGNYAAANGSYNLIDGQLIADRDIYIGDNGGNGVLTLTGGTASVSSFLRLQNGTVNLMGTGQLNSFGISIESGTFSQSGGTNTISSKYLYGFTITDGSYNLSGNSLLTVDEEYIGYQYGFTGAFNQSGGTNRTGTLHFGEGSSGGVYTLTSGTLCGGPGLTDSWRGRDNGSPNRSIR